MRELIQERGLPEPKSHRRVFGSSTGHRVSSIAASLALLTSAIIPFQIDQEKIPHFGWGGKCRTPGAQAILKEPQGVSVAQCEPNKQWYNGGFVYYDSAPSKSR